MHVLKPIALAVGLAVLAAPALAADAEEPNLAEAPKTQEPSASAAAIEALGLAQQLTAYGTEAQDPLALIVAARITAAHPTEPAQATKSAGEGDAASAPMATPEALLAQARELSGGNAEVLALIDAAAGATTSRGAIGGAKAITDKVLRGNTDVWTIEFRGRRAAEVAVIGTGGDIDCAVYDEYGNLGDSDTDYTSTCALNWTPRRDGEFKIHIRNESRRNVPYLMLTN